MVGQREGKGDGERERALLLLLLLAGVCDLCLRREGEGGAWQGREVGERRWREREHH